VVQVAVRLLVLDQQRRVVADLGSYLSFGTVGSLSLDKLGGVFLWNGAGANSTPLPNGYYRMQVQAPGGPPVEAEFYLEHQAWQAGSVLVSLLPRSRVASIRWNYSEAVNLRFDLYNLPGELVWQGRASGASGRLDWGLVSASGQDVADGIYMLKVQASSLDGAVDDIRILKLAVVR
jgi:hypothetical protein